MPRATVNQLEIIRAALALASKRTIDHLLYIGDLPLPDEAFRGKPKARKKLVQAVVSEAQRLVVEASGVPVIALPQYDLARIREAEAGHRHRHLPGHLPGGGRGGRAAGPAAEQPARLDPAW